MSERRVRGLCAGGMDHSICFTTKVLQMMLNAFYFYLTTSALLLFRSIKIVFAVQRWGDNVGN